MLFNQSISVSSPLLALGSLVFNGTAIWLSGAPNEPSNTSYDVILDTSNVTYKTYPSSGELFAANVNPSMTHRVSVNPVSVLESAVVEMDLDAEFLMVVDDAQLFTGPPAGSISVQGAWVTNECVGTGQNEGTCHTSQASGDSFSYTFAGDAVTVYGALENAQAVYTVSIDGSMPTVYTGNALSAPSTASVVLASYSNLGPGNHVITVTNTGSSKLEIDYVVLYTSETASSPSSGPSKGTGLSKSTTTGIIVGTVLGCAFVALCVLVYLVWRERVNARKLAAAKVQNGDSDQWSFGWTKKDKESEAGSLRSTSSPSTSAFPVIALVSKAPPPTHTKTSSFDQPWTESGPELSSIHPLSDAADSSPKRSGFLARWRS